MLPNYYDAVKGQGHCVGQGNSEGQIHCLGQGHCEGQSNCVGQGHFVM